MLQAEPKYQRVCVCARVCACVCVFPCACVCVRVRVKFPTLMYCMQKLSQWKTVLDFRLPPQWKRDLRSSEILRGVVCSYRRFGITYRSHLQGSSRIKRTVWPLEMGPKICPETSVPNYQSTLRDITEERIYQWRVILHFVKIYEFV